MNKEKILKNLNDTLIDIDRLSRNLKRIEANVAALTLNIRKYLPGTEYMNPADFKPERKWQPSDCRKEVEDCFCVTGYPYRMLCSKCRDKRTPGDDKDYCICG